MDRRDMRQRLNLQLFKDLLNSLKSKQKTLVLYEEADINTLATRQKEKLKKKPEIDGLILYLDGLLRNPNFEEMIAYYQDPRFNIMKAYLVELLEFRDQSQVKNQAENR